MRDKRVIDFLNTLGAKQPTPGGGAVSALNGALAAAQLKMICEYTKDDDVTSKTNFLNQKVETFVDLAETDSEAFHSVSEAYKTKDQGKISSALISALNPSMEILAACDDLVHFCEEDYQKFNTRLKADLVVALANLRASTVSAIAMMRTNIDSLGKNAPSNVDECISAGQDMLSRIDAIYKELEA